MKKKALSASQGQTEHQSDRNSWSQSAEIGATLRKHLNPGQNQRVESIKQEMVDLPDGLS
jgi:hypothetical protein